MLWRLFAKMGRKPLHKFKKIKSFLFKRKMSVFCFQAEKIYDTMSKNIESKALEEWFYV